MSLHEIKKNFYSHFKILTTDNLTKKFFRSVSKEWNTAHQEFIEDDAHRPPVHRLPVPLPQDHLWGDVLGSPADLHDTDQRNQVK